MHGGGLDAILLYVLSIGVGGSILALGFLLLEMGPLRRYGMILAAGLTLGLTGLDVVLSALGQPVAVCGAVAILPAACALAWAAHFPRVRRWASRLLDPRVIWGSLLILFPLSALYLAHGLNTAPREELTLMRVPLEPAPAGSVCVLTDTGRDIEVYNYALHESADVEDQAALLRDQEESCLVDGPWKWQVIRAGPPDLNANCHGWVFTDGQFCILSAEVDYILADNHYRQVDQPQIGDVVVYRDEKGEVLHSGLVRVVSGGDLVLVESKWGPLGRYLHPPECQPWGARFSYYRSPRGGHLLRIVRTGAAVPRQPG